MDNVPFGDTAELEIELGGIIAGVAYDPLDVDGDVVIDGDLWNILEFLNPGMLGAAAVFSRFADAQSDGDEARRTALA